MKVMGKTEWGNLDIIMLEPGDIDRGRPCPKCKDRTDQEIIETYIKPIKKLYSDDIGKGWFYKSKCLKCGNINYISGEGLDPKKLGFFEKMGYKILK